MALYEHTFLARQDISSQQAEALVEQFSNVISENGGKVVDFENWGLRTPTHRIKKNRKAHYLHLRVDAPAAALAEVERQMRIHEDILRYLTIRVEELEEGPSVMMKKNDRDDRPRRDKDERPRSEAKSESKEETKKEKEGDE